MLIFSFLQWVFFPALESFIVFEDTDVGLYSFLKKSKGNYLFILIMGWVVGGFYEEIVFHGFVFTRLEKMISGKYSLLLSFLITSVLFGLLSYPPRSSRLNKCLHCGRSISCTCTLF